MPHAYRWTALLGLSLLAGCTVGGSISGLSESGLVLLNNGGSALTVAAGASTFAFAPSLSSGSAYDVTVQTQPTGLTCTVSNGSGTASANVTDVSVSCVSSASTGTSTGASNVVTMLVAAGPAATADQTFNIPLTSVTVCEVTTGACATINDVLIDTGSSGLRLMASVLNAAGLTLASMSDPSGNGNTIQECLPFADGYTWGAVATATVTIGGETSSSAIPVQVIDDNSTGPTVPSSCTSNGTSLGSVNAFNANGVLGVGVFDQDCGESCVSEANNDIYFTCSSGGDCTSMAQPLAAQVSNPVASFPTDNNGVVLQLPSIAAAGAASTSGYLVFGIGTESNNALGSATILTANDEGNFTTTFDDQTLSGFIDSGSNALFFNDSSISLCGTTGVTAGFYCPSSTLSLSAENQGANGNTSNVSFQVANLNDISTTNLAIDDVAGPLTGINNYFDWGLPFFYGNTVFVAIEGTTVGGSYGAYAY